MASSVITMSMHGANELAASLRELGYQLEKNTLKRAGRKGANVILKSAREKVPVRYGFLKKSLRVASDRSPKKSEVKFWVSIAKNAYADRGDGKFRKVKTSVQKQRRRRYVKGEIYPRNYAHLLEFGTLPHRVGRGSGQSLGLPGLKKATGPMHPGARPRPFMRPAYDTQKENAVRAFAAACEAELPKAVAKAKAKAAGAGGKR